MRRRTRDGELDPSAARLRTDGATALHGSSHASILALQRAAGNHAVAELIRGTRVVATQRMAWKNRVEPTKGSPFVNVDTEVEDDKAKLLRYVRGQYRNLDGAALAEMKKRMELAKTTQADKWNAFDQALYDRIQRRLTKIGTHVASIGTQKGEGQKLATKDGTEAEPGNWANARMYFVFPKTTPTPSHEPQSQYDEVPSPEIYVSGAGATGDDKYRHPGAHVPSSMTPIHPKEEELSENDSEALLYSELERKILSTIKDDAKPKRIVVNVYSKMGACDGCKQRTALFQHEIYTKTGVPVRLRYVYGQFSATSSRSQQHPTAYGWADTSGKKSRDPVQPGFKAHLHNEHYPEKPL